MFVNNYFGNTCNFRKFLEIIWFWYEVNNYTMFNIIVIWQYKLLLLFLSFFFTPYWNHGGKFHIFLLYDSVWLHVFSEVPYLSEHAFTMFSEFQFYFILSSLTENNSCFIFCSMPRRPGSGLPKSLLDSWSELDESVFNFYWLRRTNGTIFKT